MGHGTFPQVRGLFNLSHLPTLYGFQTEKSAKLDEKWLRWPTAEAPIHFPSTSGEGKEGRANTGMQAHFSRIDVGRRLVEWMESGRWKPRKWTNIAPLIRPKTTRDATDESFDVEVSRRVFELGFGF